MISSLSAAYPQTQMEFVSRTNAIVWDVSLHFNEPGSAYDYVIFGEAPDANDGPPADAYDTVKPPAPMPSYIRACFNDNIPFPYNQLWKDYRHYPAMSKVWNLSVQWVPEDSESSTTITISWSSSEINTTDYVSILLCTSGGTPLRNMLLYSSYSFACPAFLPQTFQIICTANQAPYAPSDPSPSNSSVGAPVNADLSWICSDPNGDILRYDVYFGTTSSPPRIASNMTVSTYDPGVMNPGTQYYWKILARDIYNAETPGPIWHFQTNNLPNPPSDPNPSNNSEGLPLNTILSWTCFDPNDDPLTYDVYFGMSNPPGKVVSNQTSLSYNPPGDLLYGATYYWKIIAWDLNSGSRAGPLWKFKTNNLPNPPSNPNPSNGSTGVLVSVTLTWSGGDPDSGDTVTYDVYLGPSSNPPHVSYNQSSLSYNPPGDLLYDTLYYWRIVAWDNHDATYAGPLWHFTTGPEINNPPYEPNTPSPADGSTDVSLNTDLSWQGGDPDSGDNVTYNVYFGTTSSPPIVSQNQSTLLFDPGALNPYTNYYWRIKAWDDEDASTEGPLWHFRTIYINYPPYAPSNPCPANGSTQVPINTDLSWTGGDPNNGDLVKYDVYFGISFPIPKIKSNISSTTCFLDNLNYGQKYYWRVVAWDNHGEKNSSSLWSFTTLYDVTPPSVGITQPKPGWMYVNLFMGLINWKYPILFTTLVLGPIEVKATASDIQSGIDRVEFYLGNDLKYNDTTSPYSWDWQHVTFFPYELRVIAYDNAGLSSTWSLRVWKGL